MAFKEIEMWASILKQPEQDREEYEAACKKSAKATALHESKMLQSCRQRVIDPRELGFKRSFSQMGVDGKIVLESTSLDGPFVKQMNAMYPDVKFSRGFFESVKAEGCYNDLLGVWRAQRAFLGESISECDLKKQFDGAFFSEHAAEEASSLDEVVELSELGLGEGDAGEEDGNVSLALEFDPEEGGSAQAFTDAAREAGLMDGVDVAGAAEDGSSAEFSGPVESMKSLYAMYTGHESWKALCESSPDAAREFSQLAVDEDGDTLAEADYRESLAHALDIVGVNASTANIAAEDAAAVSFVSEAESPDDRAGEAVSTRSNPWHMSDDDYEAEMEHRAKQASAKRCTKCGRVGDECVCKEDESAEPQVNEEDEGIAIGDMGLDALDALADKMAAQQEDDLKKRDREALAKHGKHAVPYEQVSDASYEGMSDAEIEKEFKANHGLSDDEWASFKKIWLEDGWKVSDIASMPDWQVVDYFTRSVWKDEAGVKHHPYFGRQMGDPSKMTWNDKGEVDDDAQITGWSVPHTIDPGGTEYVDKNGVVRQGGIRKGEVDPDLRDPIPPFNHKIPADDYSQRLQREEKVIALMREVNEMLAKLKSRDSVLKSQRGKDVWSFSAWRDIVLSLPQDERKKLLKDMCEEIAKDHGGNIAAAGNEKIFLKILFGKKGKLTDRDFAEAWANADGKKPSARGVAKFMEDTEGLWMMSLRKTMQDVYGQTVPYDEKNLYKVLMDDNAREQFKKNLKQFMGGRRKGSIAKGGTHAADVEK